MPYRNILYVFYTKGTPPEIVKMIESAMRETYNTMHEELKGKTFTSSEYNSKFKSILASRLAGLPVKTRIAVLEKIDTAIPPDRAAFQLALWNPATEEFKATEYPYFEKIIDPLVNPEQNTALGYLILTLGLIPTAITIYSWLKR